MRTGSGRAARVGITRVELLVVLALAVVVLPLGVGALQAAGEEARIARCLGNLGGLMRASHAYLADYGDGFPLMMDGGATLGVASWKYGGKTSDDFWQIADGGLFFLRVTQRPLNEYVLGAEPQPDVMNGTQIVERTPMPQFQCPSDHSTHQHSYYGGEGHWSEFSTYDDVGTSYHFNLVALMDTNIDAWADGGAGWGTLVRALVRDGRLGHAETTLWLNEDPLDYSFIDRMRVIGNHGRLCEHAAGYLDGHADYKYMDTRNWCGPGWAAICPSWVRTFGQPKPPIYYTYSNENCTPLN